MKSIELLAAIGEVRNEYIQDILIPEQPELTSQHKHRYPISVLVAVLLLTAILAVTAYAAGFRISDWFRELFGSLNTEQSQVIEDMGMEHDDGEPISATVNGNSLTILSAFGDGYNAFIRLRFTGPEGINLTYSSVSDYSIYHDSYVRGTNPVDLLSQPVPESSEMLPEDYNAFSWEMRFEDVTSGDASIDAILHIALDPEGSIRFDDAVPETITIPGLWHGWDTLLEGPWQLNLGAMGGDSMDLDVAGKTAVRQLDGIIDHLILNRIVVSQIGIEVDATFEEPISGDSSFTYPTTAAVLKDGSIVAGSVGKYDGYYTELSGTTCKYKLYFDIPVELEQIDHIQFCDLILPVSGDGKVAPSTTTQDEMLQGTHVVLGDPGSLRLNANAYDSSELSAQEVYDLPISQRSATYMYAEYTSQGVQYYRYQDDGRLAITVTNARIVTDISQMGNSYAGFSPDAYMELVELEQPDPQAPNRTHKWVNREYPVCLNEDGSFKDGYCLILVDLLVENQGIENYSPEGFHTGFMTLALPGAEGPDYRDTDYFSDSTYQLPWVNYYDIPSGETKAVSVGFLITPDNTWDLSQVRGCNTSGNPNSVFIDMQLTKEGE